MAKRKTAIADLAAAARPLLLIAAIEPTARFAYNIAKNVK